MPKPITFDHVFSSWLQSEIDTYEQRDLLALAKSKGFNSITEWRLNTAIKLGMDKKVWQQIEITDPASVLPNIIVGPYKGWSLFFQNELNTSFGQALEIKEFFEWAQKHNRIPMLAANFPSPTNLILYRKPNGQLIHIEGGHRIAAFTYAQKLGKSITAKITAAVADVTDKEIDQIKEFLKQGTNKQ